MKKLKKCLDILSFYTYMCTINKDHMLYVFWNIRHDRQNFLSFVIIFCPLTPLTIQKIKILKNWNQHPEIVSIYICAPKKTIIWCMVLLIWSITDKIFCHFGPFFAILNPMGPQSRNFEQMNKVLGDIIISQMCAINDNHMIYGFWDLEHDKARVFCHFEPFFAILPH